MVDLTADPKINIWVDRPASVRNRAWKPLDPTHPLPLPGVADAAGRQVEPAEPFELGGHGRGAGDPGRGRRGQARPGVGQAVPPRGGRRDPGTGGAQDTTPAVADGGPARGGRRPVPRPPPGAPPA